jgi:hypothetical protein
MLETRLLLRPQFSVSPHVGPGPSRLRRGSCPRCLATDVSRCPGSHWQLWRVTMVHAFDHWGPYAGPESPNGGCVIKAFDH